MIRIRNDHQFLGLGGRCVGCFAEVSRVSVFAVDEEDGPAVVSLYVNDYNVRALAAYRRVGFREVGAFATVLF